MDIIKTEWTASNGAVSQDGEKSVVQCGVCMGKCVWAESKSGKWYLADVFSSESGGFYYIKGSPHFKSCDRQKEIRDAYLEKEHQIDAEVARRRAEVK
jgi:hypothetical protein